MKPLHFILSMIVLSISVPHPACCHPASLTKAQARKIESDIRNSKAHSDKSFELLGSAQNNANISSSNYDKTMLHGFSDAAATYSEAASRFQKARKTFDDAWIKMQYGLEHGNLGSVRIGIDYHNSGVELYNEGLELLNKASGVLKAAMDANKERHPARSAIQGEHRGLPETPRSPRQLTSHALPGSQKEFPIAAMIILIGTVVTSLQALKDERIIDKYILHPWSIANHNARHYTLISCGLIHADPVHLMMNIMSFSFFAFPLETIIGHWRFLAIYGGSLIFSSFVVTAKNRNNAYFRCLGASGAIAGIIFSYIIHRPHSKISFMFAPVPIPAPVFALGYVAYSYYMARNRYDNIAHDAHLWGAISGALITMVVDPGVMNLFIGY